VTPSPAEPDLSEELPVPRLAPVGLVPPARDEAALLSVLLDTGAVGFAHYGPDGRFLQVNAALARAHGAPPEAHVGRTVREMAPESADVAEPLIAQVLATGVPVVGVELSHGGSHWSTGWHPVPDPLTGACVGVALVATDASEAVAARASLRRTALTLQRSLLPATLPSTEELEVAGRYVAGGATDSDVGGDWYDVIPLGAGRVAVVIGDVMGRGVPAAAVMGQLRTAARTCARLDLRPAEVLDVLDALLRDLDQDAIATCAYGAFDPHTRQLRLASAGHLPPLLRGPGGRTRPVELEVGAPLGLGDPARETTVHLQAGSVLALCTDGLVESRTGDGVDTVCGALDAVSGSLEELADRVLAVAPSDGSQDDVALLLLRVPDDVDTRSRTVVLDVSRERALMIDVRQQARVAMRSWMLLDEVVDTATLVASELATNALVHGRGRVELRLRLTRDRLVLESVDSGHHMPRRRRAGDDDEGGRGLHLVASLAHRWGFRATDAGKVVWAELDLA
jgi:anti-sigma regulatory factor (Ser/Thr protein kinase)